MDGDDRPIGRVLSRREVLTLIGTAGLVACAPRAADHPPTPTEAQAAPAGAALPACIARPALTEGPYFVDEKLQRSDIRESKPGTALMLAFNVLRVAGGSCSALAGAQVDIWHCDAAGVYSDATDPSFNTKGQTFLRGYQVTDANGRATFTTIYPGWYQGRAVHVHFKIRVTAQFGSVSDFTSQLFFDETVNDAVLAQPPYAQRPASGRLRNSGDGIYQGGGAKLLVTPSPSGSGYSATFDIGLA